MRSKFLYDRPIFAGVHCYQGCDSLVNFQLTVIDPVADILGGGTLSCAIDSIILNSAPTGPAGVKTWKKLDGTVLATNVNSLVVFQTGTIILTTTQQQSGVMCSKSDTVVIAANYTVPTATAATGDTLACQQPTVQLLGSSTTPGATFRWTGPNGFFSTAMSPTAYAAGTYTLTVTHPLSQCAAATTTVVLADADGSGYGRDAHLHSIDGYAFCHNLRQHARLQLDRTGRFYQ